MKVEIEGDEIRIIGDKYGKKRHIKIYVSSDEESDYYSFSLVKDGFIHGCLPSVMVYKDDIVIQNNLERGRQLYKD